MCFTENINIFSFFLSSFAFSPSFAFLSSFLLFPFNIHGAFFNVPNHMLGAGDVDLYGRDSLFPSVAHSKYSSSTATRMLLNKPLAYDNKYLLSCWQAGLGWAQLVIHAMGSQSAVLGSGLSLINSLQRQTKEAAAIQGILFPWWIMGTQERKPHCASTVKSLPAPCLLISHCSEYVRSVGKLSMTRLTHSRKRRE